MTTQCLKFFNDPQFTLNQYLQAAFITSHLQLILSFHSDNTMCSREAQNHWPFLLYISAKIQERSKEAQWWVSRGYQLMKHKWTATLKISLKLLAFLTELLTCFITIYETERSTVYSSLMISANCLIYKAGYLRAFYCFMGKSNPQIKLEYDFVVKVYNKKWVINSQWTERWNYSTQSCLYLSRFRCMKWKSIGFPVV